MHLEMKAIFMSELLDDGYISLYTYNYIVKTSMFLFSRKNRLLRDPQHPQAHPLQG